VQPAHSPWSRQRRSVDTAQKALSAPRVTAVLRKSRQRRSVADLADLPVGVLGQIGQVVIGVEEAIDRAAGLGMGGDRAD